jgi:hypothetical protein
MKKLIVLALIVASSVGFLLANNVSHAAGGVDLKVLSKGVANDAYVVRYQTDTPPLKPVSVYLWVGEYSKTSTTNTWISRNKVIQNLPTGNTGYPKVFNAEINFVDYGIQPGIKYEYLLTDKDSGSATNSFDPNTAESLLGKCFTTTGSVPCKTPAANPTLDSSSFTLTPDATAADPEHPGKFLTHFSIVPNITLYADLQVTLKIYNEMGANPVFVKEGSFPISPGGGTVFPTVEDLAPGNYSATLFAGTKEISGNVGWAIGANGTGGVKGDFDYKGTPSVACDTGTKKCKFAVPILVTTDGALQFQLEVYPSIYTGSKPDPSKYQGVSISAGDVVSATTGPIDAFMEVPFDDITEITTNNDPDFLFFFHEIKNNKYSDFGPKFVSSSQKVPIGTGATGGPGGFDFGGAAAGSTFSCGAANATSNPALTVNSATLCTNSSVVEFNYDGFNYTWKCKESTAGTTVSCTATGGTDTQYGNGFLKNPLASGLDTFPKIFAAVYNNIILPVAVPFIVLAIIYAGFKFVMARKEGRTDGYTEAKRVLKYTLIGTGLILGGWVIANALQGTLNSLLGPDSGKATAMIQEFNPHA